MSEFVCHCCDSDLDECELVKNVDRDYLDVGVGRVCIREDVFCSCPYCGSTDVVEKVPCDVCNELFDPDDLDEGFCPDCLEKYYEEHPEDRP